MTDTEQMNATLIFGLPEEDRVGYVLGMSREVADTYVANAARKLLETHQVPGLSHETLTRAMRSRVESLIGYNTRPATQYNEAGVDLNDDYLESLFGTGSFVTGADMMRAFTQPKIETMAKNLINYARLDALSIAAKLLSDAGLRERATPLMAKFGEAYMDHVVDEKFGR